eukprot:CFRG7065T1
MGETQVRTGDAADGRHAIEDDNGVTDGLTEGVRDGFGVRDGLSDGVTDGLTDGLTGGVRLDANPLADAASEGVGMVRHGCRHLPSWRETQSAYHKGRTHLSKSIELSIEM